MRLVYIDEAGISNRVQEPWLVVSAVIVDADKTLVAVERHLDKIVRRFIPEEHQGDFIFHATHLFMWGGKVFTRNHPGWPLHKRLEIADELAAIPKKFGLTLTHALLERAKFPSEPDEISSKWTPKENLLAAHVCAFIACAANVERWMRENTQNEVCMLIVENNEEAKSMIRQFHNEYQNPKLAPSIQPEASKYYPFRRIKQDPLFEPKKKSSVLQLADFWAYVAKRNAMNPGDVRYSRFLTPMVPQIYPPVRVRRLS